MNSTFLRVLAALMVIAAIVTAFLGYRQSHRQATDTLKVVVPTYSQVVARKDLPAGHTLSANDLEVVNTQQLDKKAFSEPHSLIGKVITVPIAKGTPLKSSHIPSNDGLSYALTPHERAVAIKVNEVIGVGGFIKPGDQVDVLLYLRADKENGETSSAQVVISNVKVLAYGDLVPDAEDEQTDTSKKPTSLTLGGNKKSAETSKKNDSRSAILAVAEQDISKLMLAESAGQLRLALRAKTYQPTTPTGSESNRFISMGDIAQSSSRNAVSSKNNAVSMTVQPNKTVKHSSSKRERVTIHRGEQVEVINVVR